MENEIVLSKKRFNQVMLDASMFASDAFAKREELDFETELMLMSYSAFLSRYLCDLLFEEVTK